jgi:hypothetical protein
MTHRLDSFGGSRAGRWLFRAVRDAEAGYRMVGRRDAQPSRPVAHRIRGLVRLHCGWVRDSRARVGWYTRQSEAASRSTSCGPKGPDGLSWSQVVTATV